MKIGFASFALAACGLLGLAAPATARSVITETFAATVLAESQVLQSADAAAQARSTRLRAFARRDSARAAAALDAIAAWEQAEALAATAASEAPTIDHLGPVFGALDPARRPVTAAPTLDEAAALAQLQTLDGPAFDALYVDIARAALEHREAADKEYILNGDDTTLRAFAVHDLPKVEALVAVIQRF